RPLDAHHALALVDGEGQGLLAVHVLAGAHGGDGDEGVPVVGRADGDRVDVAVLQQLAEVLDSAAVAADEAGGVVAVVPVHVADGDELHAALAHGVLHDVDAALAVQLPAAAPRVVGADADGGHDDAV